MHFERSHKTITNLVVAVMAAAIVFYSEQALADTEVNARAVTHGQFLLRG